MISMKVSGDSGERRLTEFEVERRGRVQDNLEACGLHHLVEGVRPRDVRHDDNIKLVLPKAGVRSPDLLCLVLRPHSGYDLVALLEQQLQDMSCCARGSTQHSV